MSSACFCGGKRGPQKFTVNGKRTCRAAQGYFNSIQPLRFNWSPDSELGSGGGSPFLLLYLLLESPPHFVDVGLAEFAERGPQRLGLGSHPALDLGELEECGFSGSVVLSIIGETNRQVCR
jgi:hypothetical protein